MSILEPLLEGAALFGVPCWILAWAAGFRLATVAVGAAAAGAGAGMFALAGDPYGAWLCAITAAGAILAGAVRVRTAGRSQVRR